MAVNVLRGNLVSLPALGRMDITEHGYLVLEDGVISGIYPVLPEQYRNAPLEDYGDCLILQSFCDMHMHAPQYPLRAVGLDLPLLEWLNAYTFPAEARFADPEFARAAYRRLAHDFVANGTTRVCLFASLHRPATLSLMEELEKAGLVGYVGKVNMDRNGGKDLQETTEESQRETLRWLDECQQFHSIRPMLTPRFTPACTDELMAFLGRLVQERDLPVQSHLSENLQEMEWVRSLHPDCPQYWNSYAKYGLWTNRTLMAHCVHVDERERRAIREAGVTVVHCANSNIDLCSGIAPVRQMLNEGLKVVLGSDIGGSTELNGFDIAAATIRASKVRRIMDNWQTDFFTEAEAWYLGTTAAAHYFGGGDGFAVGDRLHALVLDDSQLLQPHPLSVKERFQRSMYVRQPNAIRAVWGNGIKLLG